MTVSPIQLSIILPIYNEEDNVEPVLNGVLTVLDDLDRSYEVIAVNDGSSDKTLDRLRAISHPNLRIVNFARNFGQTAAMAAGFDHAQGDIWIPMDADGQNDPKDIPKMLAYMEQVNADIVSGWRKNRKDAGIRRFPSKVANALISKVTGVALRDYGCTLKTYRASVMRETRLYGDLHRFVPALASWSGARVVEMPVEHHARTRGKSKYGLSRTFRVILDLMTVKFLLSFGNRPIHMFGGFGLVSLGIGSVLLAYLAFVRLVLQHAIAGRPLLMGAILLVLVGFQFLSMGLISELLVRVYHESSNKRTYVVKHLLNFPPEIGQGAKHPPLRAIEQPAGDASRHERTMGSA